MRSPYEIKAQKYLEGEGYAVDYKMRPSRPTKHYNTDYFNIFDLIAYKPRELRFISIKGTMGIVRSHRKDVEDILLPEGCSKEIWNMTKKGIWRREVIE